MGATATALAAATPGVLVAEAGSPAIGSQGGEEPAPGTDAVYAAPTRIDRVGRIAAPVMINGQGPFRFILDTGASRSAISPQLALQLGLIPSPDTTLTIQGVTGTEVVPSVLVKQLQAGEIVLQNRRLPVITSSVFANTDGILGVEGFDKMRIMVDFAQDRIIISTTRSAQMRGRWSRVPVRLRFGRLMIADATIGNVYVKAVIDTGAERTLGNLALRSALHLDSASQQTRTESQVIGATSAEEAANSISAPMIRLGQIDIKRVNVTFADLNVFRIWNLEHAPALVLGMDVLGTPQALLFDYQRSELLIRPWH